MQEARRQACVAVEFYNRAGERASFYDFVVHMHLAWQNLLQADLEQRGQNIFHKKPNGHYDRTSDGEKRSWDLTYCLKREFPDGDPLRANVELFIGLRHKIEHRFQEAFIIETAPHAHALVINFETELVRRFGQDASLGDKLRFPVFIHSLTPDGFKKQRALRKKLPVSARNYITEFEANLDPAVQEDERFMYRVMMTPIKGPKSDADAALRFVRMDDMSAEDQRAMIDSAGRAVVIEKMRDVALKDEMLPKTAAAAVEALIPFKFNVSDFTKMRQALQVGPGPKNVGRLKNSHADLCVEIRSTKQWVYSKKFVKKLADQLRTENQYQLTLGKPAVKKSLLKATSVA